MVNFTPGIIYLRERTRVPPEQEAGWEAEPVRMFWRSEKSLDPVGIRISYHPACSLGNTNRPQITPRIFQESVAQPTLG